ncbi:UPF0755 protein [Allocatelliglobosispora scoriae]|uniref:Endolytic murein transglycosylase n=1 Tax=Allocatelliglobosispora scoriae TaxID=643052 RepID=A0A841BZL1_9ACTN|nr:endolytic transglycosylase MltG [Allocatelliglobosispora scoriae]MBB5873125.1 UPF0755 protein [Allocatelliglobosispora scoriae]
MIDELDLGYEDHDRGRSRHRRSSQRRSAVTKKKRGGKSWLALLLTLLLLGGLAGGVYIAYDKVSSLFSTPDYDGSGTAETVTIEVKQGDFIADMGNTLFRADVVKSAQAFVDAAEGNPAAVGIQPGFYKVSKQQSAESALAALLDAKNRLVNKFTVPEGMITLQVYDKLAKEFGFKLADVKALAADPVKLGVPEWWFNRKDGKKSARSLEGFLFPSTYDFPPNVTAELALKLMVKQFLDVTTRLGFVDKVQAERGISPYEALVAASIAQAEAVNDKDMGPVARALYNRVYAGKYGPCKCLQIDSAVNYWFRLQGKEPKDSNDLYQAELHDKKNPYNTHVVDGLPVGPISNPGEAALKGAMDPPPSDYVFFVTIDKQGTMGYAKDGQLQTLINEACKNGVLHGDLC